MIDHVTIGVSDLERSRAFYRAALAPLGYAESPHPSAVPGEIEFGRDGTHPFAISTTPAVAPRAHVAG
jgi:catechol 2,3-dioxygenase-like lactoylglutathione lyase family enzyme